MIAQFHYDRDVLLRLLRDEHSSDINEIQAHVENCDLCQNHLDSLSAGSLSWDDIVDYMRQDEMPDMYPPDSESATRTLVPFLDDSAVPNTIGRFGRYEILEVLGRGGMGIVMRGLDSALDRSCAIKVLAPELASSAAARKRFSREAKSAAAVVHPHVVPIQNVDEHNGLPYLVMPVVEGLSLQQRVERDGPLDVITVVRIATQIADGLSAAHSQGLVHRDIKPANVLLENGVERVQITDFGLARAVDDASMTRSGIIAGTPQYMSPEQAHGDTIDHRSDLFSLGSVMYFMLSGHSPFRAETSMGVLNRICNDAPRSLRSINSDVPRWLENIVGKLLEKSPAKRYQSAEELKEMLRDSLSALNDPTNCGSQASVVDHVKDPHHLHPPKKGSLTRSTTGGIGHVLIAIGFAFVAFAGIIFYLQTNNGTLRIESNSELDVPIRIVQGDTTVEQLTVSKEGATMRLRAGNYAIEVDDADSLVEVQGDRFTLRRGDTWLVAITPVTESGRSAEPAAHDIAISGFSAGISEYPSQDSTVESRIQAIDSQHATENQNNLRGEPNVSDPETAFALNWDDGGKVTVNANYAQSLGLNGKQTDDVNRLLQESWQSYIDLEKKTTTVSHMETGGVYAEVEYPGEPLERLRRRLRSQLWSLLRDSAAESIYSIAVNRRAKEPDDIWSDTEDAYPSILGWSDQNYPVKLQITYHKGKVHWWIRPGKHGVTGNDLRLPPELEHFFWLDSRPDLLPLAIAEPQAGAAPQISPAVYPNKFDQAAAFNSAEALARSIRTCQRRNVYGTLASMMDDALVNDLLVGVIGDAVDLLQKSKDGFTEFRSYRELETMFASALGVDSATAHKMVNEVLEKLPRDADVQSEQISAERHLANRFIDRAQFLGDAIRWHIEHREQNAAIGEPVSRLFLDGDKATVINETANHAFILQKRDQGWRITNMWSSSGSSSIDEILENWPAELPRKLEDTKGIDLRSAELDRTYQMPQTSLPDATQYSSPTTRFPGTSVNRSIERLREEFFRAHPHTLSDWAAKSQGHSVIPNFVDIHLNQHIAVTIDNKPDDSAYVVRFWDSKSGEFIRASEKPGVASSVRFAKDGQVVAIRKFLDPVVDILEVRTGKMVKQLHLAPNTTEAWDATLNMIDTGTLPEFDLDSGSFQSDSRPSSANTEYDSVKADWQSKLAGQWQVEMKGYDDDGKIRTETVPGHVMGDRITFTSDDEKATSFGFEVVAKGPPTQIDVRPIITAFERAQLQQSWEFGEPPNDLINPVFHGIIEPYQDGFRICLPAEPSGRATEFSISTDRGMWILKRPEAATHADEATSNQDSAPGVETVVQAAPTVQVLFRQPQSAKLTAVDDAYQTVVAPGRLNLNADQTHHFQISEISNHDGLSLAASISLAPLSTRTSGYLAHNAIPFELTNEDIEQVLAGNPVRKVIYLPDPENAETAIAGVATNVTHRLDPGLDAFEEAERRGEVLATLTIGNHEKLGE